MITKLSLKTFLRKYNTDEACLEEIKNFVYPDGITCPKCQKITKCYKIEGRMSYSCGVCRTQVYPLAGTVFHKSTTPLRIWFYVMWTMVKTRSGVSARTIMRETGVTYKCAFRMCHQLRKLMADGGVTGVYTHVSPKYLRNYADEYGFRYGNRQLGDGMFYEMLKQVSVKRA